jgi:hypothetical protein
MADREIQKTLDLIAKRLADGNKSQEESVNKTQSSEIKEALSKTVIKIDNKYKETQPDTKAQNEQDKTAVAVEKGVLAANKKTYPVDFWSNFASSLKGFQDGIKKISKGFGELGKALGLDKIKKVTGGFWDFLKKLISIGFAATGIIKFIEGWNKANEWFGGNADFGDRVASALANILGSVLGWKEDDKQKAAIKIAKFFDDVGKYLSKEFTAFKSTINDLFQKGAFKDVIDGVRLLLDGDFKQSFEKLKNGISAIIGGIVDSESTLLKIFGVYFGAKLLGKMGKALIGLGSALKMITGGIWDVATSANDMVSGKKQVKGPNAGKRAGGIAGLLRSSISGLKSMSGFIAPILGSMLFPILAGAALLAIFSLLLKNMPKTPSMMGTRGEVNDETISAFRLNDGGLQDDPSLQKKLPNGENAYAVVRGSRDGQKYEMAVDENRFKEIEKLKAIMNNNFSSEDERIQATKQLDNLIVQFLKAQNPKPVALNTPNFLPKNAIIQGENLLKAIASEQDENFKKLGLSIIGYKKTNEASQFFKENLQFKEPEKMIKFLQSQENLIQDKVGYDQLIKALEKASGANQSVQQANIDQRQTLTNIFSNSRSAGTAALAYNN